MPYDNNLSHFGTQIINEIQEGINSNQVVATVQADFADTNGMQRFIINNHETKSEKIYSEQSASVRSFKNYLIWVKSTFEYKHIALVFLNHGGQLNETGLDLFPEKGYLEIKAINKTIKSVLGDDSLDLLFFQVCNKANIESIYTFRNTAKYTLASQIELGAPNSYYSELFTLLSKGTIENGSELAEEIVSNDSESMYNSYTLVNNRKLDSLFTLTKSFVKALKRNKVNMPDTIVKEYVYLGESYHDFISSLQAIDLDDQPQLLEQRIELIQFIEEELILFHKLSASYEDKYSLNGLGFLVGKPQKNYNYLRFYKLLRPLRKLN